MLLNFADIAIKNYYVKPELNESRVIDIKGGRHPVIEKTLPVGEDYITNDVFLDSESQQIINHYRTQYGGQICSVASNRFDSTNGADGLFVPAKFRFAGHY